VGRAVFEGTFAGAESLVAGSMDGGVIRHRHLRWVVDSKQDLARSQSVPAERVIEGRLDGPFVDSVSLTVLKQTDDSTFRCQRHAESGV